MTTSLVIIAISFIVILIYRNIFFPKKYENIVNMAAHSYNIDPNLIYAIIKQESNFNAQAISKSNAKGLMQIIDSTANEMAQDINTVNAKSYNIFDPYTNIFIGTKYISYLINRFNGNYYLAIVAYNAGLGKVDEWTNKQYAKYSEYREVEKIIEYNETKLYFLNVLKNYNYYVVLYE